MVKKAYVTAASVVIKATVFSSYWLRDFSMLITTTTSTSKSNITTSGSSLPLHPLHLLHLLHPMRRLLTGFAPCNKT